MMVHAVFFDVGGTLMYDNPPVPEVFTRVAQRRGHDITVDDIMPCMDDVNGYYKAEYMRDGDFWCVHARAVQIWLDMYTIMAKYACLDDEGLPQAVYDEYLKPDNWSLFPDAEICIRKLKEKGFRLAVVSNWDSTLEDLIRKMGYLPYFDEVVSSASVGYRKPDKAIFDIALERMGLQPQEVVHVGDLPEADGDGAMGAGIKPVIIDRYGWHEACKYERVTTLESLPELL